MSKKKKEKKINSVNKAYEFSIIVQKIIKSNYYLWEVCWVGFETDVIKILLNKRF
jgi:hypothetical protein